MTARRIVSGVGIAFLVLLTGFMVLQLVRKADAAEAARKSFAAAETAGRDLPVAATWRLSLYFDRGQTYLSGLGSGWSLPEPGAGVWSSSKLAVLKLPPLPPGAADVALQLEAFVAATHPVQRIRVRTGAQTLGEWRLDKGELTTLHLALPQGARPADGLELQIDLPDADAPIHHVKGSTETRQLAIKLHRVLVTG